MNEFRQKYNKKSTNNSTVTNNQIKTLSIKKNSINTTHEEELIKLILKENNLALLLNQIVYDEDFGEYKYNDIFKNLYQTILNGSEITKEYLNAIIVDDLNMDNIFKEVDLDEDNIKLLFYDCYKRLKIRYLEGIRTIKNNDLTKINDEILQKEKMNEILRLAKKIKSLKEEVY